MLSHKQRSSLRSMYGEGMCIYVPDMKSLGTNHMTRSTVHIMCRHISCNWYVSLNKYVCHITNMSHCPHVVWQYVSSTGVYVRQNTTNWNIYFTCERQKRICLPNFTWMPYIPYIWWAYMGDVCAYVRSHWDHSCDQESCTQKTLTTTTVLCLGKTLTCFKQFLHFDVFPVTSIL